MEWLNRWELLKGQLIHKLDNQFLYKYLLSIMIRLIKYMLIKLHCTRLGQGRIILEFLASKSILNTS